MKALAVTANLALLAFLLIPAGCTKSPKPGKPMNFDAAKIYPYIITTHYLKYQTNEPPGLTYPIGHQLFVTLVQDIDGLAQFVRGKDLVTAGITPRQAHARAVENLVQLVKSKAVTMQLFEGPHGKPFIIFTDHWLSAACVLLPDLYETASSNLGTNEICVCLPQRDSMLLFPRADSTFRKEMMTIIRKNESDARKPLSFGLFELDANGFKEFNDPPTFTPLHRPN